MKILLLGGNGFIGSSVNIELSKKRNFFSPHKKEINLLNTKTLYEFIYDNKIKCIINCAGASRLGDSKKKTFTLNTFKIIDLLDKLVDYNFNGKFINCSSSLIYKKSNKPLKESTEKFNLTLNYTLSKYLTEKYGLNIQKNFEFISARIFNSIGIAQSNEYLIPSIFNQILNNKKIYLKNSYPIRDFIDVRDVARALINIVYKVNSDSIINICSGKGTSIREICDKVNNMYSNKLEFFFENKKINHNDIIIGDRKLLDKTNHKNIYTLESTLRQFKEKNIKKFFN